MVPRGRQECFGPRAVARGCSLQALGIRARVGTARPMLEFETRQAGALVYATAPTPTHRCSSATALRRAVHRLEVRTASSTSHKRCTRRAVEWTKSLSRMTHTPARLVRSLALGPKPDACLLTVTDARVGCGGLRVPLDPRVMGMAVTAASQLISRPLLKVWTVGWKQGPGVPST